MVGIYKITNLTNGLSYIGQSNEIEKRWQSHINHKSSSLIHQAIKIFGVENFSFEVLEECLSTELNEKEKYWIKYYNTFEGDGYNLTPGGGQGVQYDCNLIYENFLQTNSIADTAKNIGCSKSTVRKIIHGFGITKKYLQEEKPVEQIDPITLQVLNKFESIGEAANAMNVSRTLISLAANGQKDSANGFFWRFEGDLNKKFISQPIKKWKRKIYKLNYDTLEVLEEFESAAEAARSLGKDGKNGGSQIISVCKGTKKSAYGFKWKYAE